MKDTLVIKFGGSVLSSDEMIGRAADMVREVVGRGLGAVVVVSALQGVTDGLIGLTKKVNPNVPDDLLDEVLSMGERTSARLFTGALNAKGLQPVLVDPSYDNWPIVTDERHQDANPIYSETAARVEEKIQPLIEAGKIPVVSGFIGVTKSGKTTTLGRGGSDTTAILLGSCLNAKEVVLVKDVDTVFSSDPDKVSDTIPVSRLDAEEAYALTVGGAKFLHPKALGYNREGVRLRIASLTNSSQMGTVIDGGSVELKVEVTEAYITMVTMIGFDASEPENLHIFMNEVRGSGGRLIASSIDTKSAIFYVEGGEGVLNRLHHVMVSKGLGKALSFYEHLAMVTVKGRAMETAPGMIQRVTQPLARHGINIYGLVTIASSIRIFVKKDEADRAVSLLRDALMVTEG